MTVSDQPAFGALMPGYTAGQYLDTPPSFAVYSDKSHLDKGWQAADIYDHFNGDTSKMERDIPRATLGTLSGSLNSWAAGNDIHSALLGSSFVAIVSPHFWVRLLGRTT